MAQFFQTAFFPLFTVQGFGLGFRVRLWKVFSRRIKIRRPYNNVSKRPFCLFLRRTGTTFFIIIIMNTPAVSSTNLRVFSCELDKFRVFIRSKHFGCELEDFVETHFLQRRACWREKEYWQHPGQVIHLQKRETSVKSRGRSTPQLAKTSIDH